MSQESPVYSPALDRAPKPDARTLRKRKNLIFQFYRFIIINLKMVRVIFHKD